MQWEPGVFGDEMANGFWGGLTPNGCVPRGSSLVRLHLKVLVIGCLDSGLFRFPRNA